MTESDRPEPALDRGRGGPDRRRAMIKTGEWHDDYGWDVVSLAAGQALRTSRHIGAAHEHWLRAQGATFDPGSLTWTLRAPTSLQGTGELLMGIVTRGMSWCVVAESTAEESTTDESTTAESTT